MKDGRWGNVSVPVVGPDEANLLGADVYGRMRSPWNVNDRTYLSRGLGEMCGIPSTDFCESYLIVLFCLPTNCGAWCVPAESECSSLFSVVHVGVANADITHLWVFLICETSVPGGVGVNFIP